MKVSYRSIERDISWYLNKSRYSAEQDRDVFNRWVRKQITTSMAISQFKSNNDIPVDLDIREDEFVEWLASIGWKRTAE